MCPTGALDLSLSTAEVVEREALIRDAAESPLLAERKCLVLLSLSILFFFFFSLRPLPAE